MLALLTACGSGDAANTSTEAPPEVIVATIAAQPVTLTRELPGRTRPYLIAEVRPQVRGIIKERLFTEGGTVKAGQPLYEIDDAIYRAEYQSAQAELLKARAALQAAKLAADRSRDLVRIDAVSAQENEEAVAAEAQAEAQVRVAEAAVARTRVNLDYAHIVAPIDGRIGKSSVTRGALVTAEQTTPLATIQQLDPIYVEMNQASSEWLAFIEDMHAGRVQPPDAGAPVKIRLDNGTQYDGKFEFADTTVDAATGNLLLRAIVSNPRHVLLPGMYVRAVVSEGVLTQGILVPQQAVARQPSGLGRALLVDAEGKVESRDVTLSRAIGNQWLVREGLKAGDRIIVEGQQKTSPGSTVQPMERVAARSASEH
jgi:membrane fusion protein (multidrug efflux system)